MVSIVAVAAALICAGGWFHTHQKLRDVRQAQVADTINPIAEMLKENSTLTKELEAAPFAEGDNQFVSAYLIKIRRDGVPKHSDMKQRIDRLVNNNTAILALLAKYSTHARTPAFRASAERFRDYAISLRDRWQSVPEIFMAGGNLPVTAPLFPADFSQDVQTGAGADALLLADASRTSCAAVARYSCLSSV
jgi:hypothetical protein